MSDPFDPRVNPAKPPRNPPPERCVKQVKTLVKDGDDEPISNDDDNKAD